MKFLVHNSKGVYGYTDTEEQAECLALAVGGASIEYIEQFGDG